MFMAPLEQSKPWNTNGIDGVYRFLRRWKSSMAREQFQGKRGSPDAGRTEDLADPAQIERT